MDRSRATSHPQRRAQLLVVLAAGVMTVWGVALVTSAGAAPENHKVTLCHATASHTNPYVSVTVDHHSIVTRGHGAHEGPVFFPGIEDKWGDIIPAFDFGDGASFSGANVEGGTAILANGCRAGGTTTTTTVETPTTTSGT